MPGEYETRREFLQLTAEDALRLAELGRRMLNLRRFFIDGFYDHLLRFEKTREILADPRKLERLKEKQADYFARLFCGDYGPAYARNRYAVGEVHQRLGLDPQWYLGAYAMYLRALLPEIASACEGDWRKTLAYYDSLLKVVFLDMGIAIETYIAADQKHLRELKEFYEQVVQAIGDPVCITNREGAILEVNEAFCLQNGWSRKEAIGQNFRMLDAGLTEKDVYARMWESLLAGKRWKGKVFNKKLDGEVYLAEFSAAPVFGTSGEIRHFVFVHRDLTRPRTLF